MENLAIQGEEFYMTGDGEKRGHTVEDILALPEGERAELIDGEMFMMASPTVIHQEVSGWMNMEIRRFICNKGGRCKIFYAPFAVFLKNDDRNYVEPDIVVICDRDKLDDKGCHGAPDWVIEIVSPASKTMDYYKKLQAYIAAGVREYWIVDPGKETVIVYDIENGEVPRFYHFTDSINSVIFEELVLDFRELKAYLQE